MMLQKQQTQKIVQPSAYWTPVFDQLNEAVIFFDDQLNILRSNAAWQNFSHNTDMVLNRYIYPEDLYLFIQSMQSGFSRPIHIRLIQDSEHLAWFEVKMQKIEVIDCDEEHYFWSMIACEQTDLVKARYLKDARQRVLKGILTRMPIMLYRSRNNRDWTMEYVSEGCQQITGHTETELINSPLYGQLIHPHDREYVWSNIQEALQRHGCFHIRYRLNVAENQTHWVQEIGQGAYSESGMVLGIDGIVFQTQAELC
ncbi:PAS domain-containing protein (plasmid) [Acinetobacter sp. ANC 7454]|uniref:PAS domain-containing protein n=1 Tax=Acinetobacter baumannii TaxID=470 RepID=A0A9Q8L2K4_ACIBA|nr:PAS domain-containing protein [Acinetobacter baumannii]